VLRLQDISFGVFFLCSSDALTISCRSGGTALSQGLDRQINNVSRISSNCILSAAAVLFTPAAFLENTADGFINLRAGDVDLGVGRTIDGADLCGVLRNELGRTAP
jgi:hypothetical protein